jgi:DNA-binding MarR family transcriptional regulator
MIHPSEEQAISDFAGSIGMLVRRVRAAAASQELSWSETVALKHLAKAGPLTTAELARAQGMRPQSMRTIVAALEKLAMVERKPHPTDGRQVLLELTARGAAVNQDAAEAKRTWLAHAITQLNRRDRETLLAAGRVIRQLVESNPQ